MAENILKLIPTLPEFIPEINSIEKAKEKLNTFFPRAAEINIKLTEGTRFIDPGSNLIKIICPFCGDELEITWWQTVMDVAYSTNFSDLLIVLPCCKKSISLNDLHYEWPAGFARFSLEVQAPDGDIDDIQLKSLEQIIGYPLKKIMAQY